MNQYTREELAGTEVNKDELATIMLSLLFDIRDAVAPPPVKAGPVDRKKFPKDCGPGTVQFSSDKAVLIDFEADNLDELFVPFSRMPPGIKELCNEGHHFNEFFVGEWIYEKLLDKAAEKAGEHHDGGPSNGRDFTDDDIPF